MSYLDTLLNDEAVWTAIAQYTVGRARPGTGDFKLKLNCPMCVSRGTSADQRYRCGIARTAQGVGVYCFNCEFRARFTIGQRLSGTMKSFLFRLGAPEREIKSISLRIDQVARMADTVKAVQPDYVPAPRFAAIGLPPSSQTLEAWADAGCDERDYLDVVQYLLGRGEVAAMATSYYWTPQPKYRRRLLIPCRHDGGIVGWTGRSIDSEDKPKYYNQIPNDYLFNAEFLNHPTRKYIFIVEGIFDALVLDGVAAMRSRLSSQQVRWINQCDKIPVVIPDRDEAGKRLVEDALVQKWGVAIPNHGARHWWDGNIKDVDEAVLRHGKLAVLQSIIGNISFDPTVIGQRLHYLSHT